MVQTFSPIDRRAQPQGVHALPFSVDQIPHNEACLKTGVVQLSTCHRAPDTNQKFVIAFNPERGGKIKVVSSEGMGSARLEGHRAELTDVRRGGSVCINLSSRALDRVDDRTWRMNAGPLMRRYLDGYLPMRALLAFRWPEGLLRTGQINPGEQPGVALQTTTSGLSLDLTFAGRMRATIDLVQEKP